MLLQFRADFRSKTRPTTVPQTTSLKKSQLTILMCKSKNEINISRVKSLSMAFDTCCTARYSKATCTALLHWSTIGDGQAIRRTAASKSRCPANCLSDPTKLPWIYCTRLVKHLVTPTTITRQANAGFNMIPESVSLHHRPTRFRFSSALPVAHWNNEQYRINPIPRQAGKHNITRYHSN